MSKNITECKSCKKEVAKTAKTCPHCGQKHPGINTGKGCLIVVAIIVIIGISFALMGDSNSPKEEKNINLDTTSNSKPKTVEDFPHTRRNIQLVVESLDKNYGIKAKNEFREDYCIHDKFCVVQADTVQIQANGYIVEPLPSSQVTPAYYQQVCSAVLIALSGGADKELAEQIIVQHFNYAAQNGSARSDVLGVDLRVTPDSRNILGCRFVKGW